MEEILTVRVRAPCGSITDSNWFIHRLSAGSLSFGFYTREVAVRGRARPLFSVPSVPPWFIPLWGFTDV